MWRNDKDGHRHESIRAVVEIKSHMLLVRMKQLMDIFIKEYITLNGRVGQFGKRDSSE
jgi:hypothetical protein